LLSLIIVLVILPSNALAASKMPQGTKIANISVQNKTESEIRDLLETEIAIWLANDITIENEFESAMINSHVISFDLDATLNELHNKTKRTLFNFFTKPKNIQVPLHVDIDENHADLVQIKNKEYIDYEQLIDTLRITAEHLGDTTIPLPYKDDADIPLETIANVKLKVPGISKATLEYIVNELDGYTIEPNELFSFLQSIETPEKLLQSRDESSFLATALYALFLQADFEIVERFPQLTIPAYSEHGINAEVNKRENKNLIVLNNNDSAYELTINYENDFVEASLKGTKSNFTYEINVKNEKEIKPRTIYRYSKRIKPGEHEVIQAGENGLKVDVYRSVYEDGVFIEEKLVSKDLYLPTPLILLVSPDDEIEEESLEIDVPDDSESTDSVPIPNYIADELPNDVKDTVVYEQLKYLEDMQRSYETFLENLLELTVIDQDMENLNLFIILQERIDKLERDIHQLIDELIKQDIVDDDFFEQRKDGVD